MLAAELILLLTLYIKGKAERRLYVQIKVVQNVEFYDISRSLKLKKAPLIDNITGLTLAGESQNENDEIF